MRAMAHHNKVCENVVSDLKHRNDSERRFEGVVKLCVSLHESVDFLMKENDRLRVQKLRLEQENVEYRCTSSQPELGGNAALMKKIYDLQIELAILHKTKNERAEEIIELRRALDEKEKQLKQKTEELENAEAALQAAKNQKDVFEDKASEAETNLQLVKDEHAALLLTFSSLDKAYDALEKEYQDVLSRWLAYKAKMEESSSIDYYSRKEIKQIEIKKAIEQAIKEPYGINPGPSNFRVDCDSKS